MKVRNALQQLTHVLTNLKKMLILSWEMDKKVTFGYYFTAMLGSLAPLIGSLTLKYLIDSLIGTNISNSVVVISLIVNVILATRYLLNMIESIVQWGLNGVYFDYLFRYTIQNELNRRFYDKLSSLDIAHLEDSKTQNLISKTRDTMTWTPPDFLTSFSFFFISFLGYIPAFIVLLPFACFIP